jgi:hypothetical protein
VPWGKHLLLWTGIIPPFGSNVCLETLSPAQIDFAFP